MAEFDYRRYLASREWAERKAAVRLRAGRASECGAECERCHLRPVEAIHHLTYERIGNEALGDLLGVCVPCHDWLSGRTDADPARSEEALEVARHRAAKMTDRLPPDGIYWHGRNGLPCPCEECCTGQRAAPREVVLQWAGRLVGP